jgi:hypothetical protein
VDARIRRSCTDCHGFGMDPAKQVTALNRSSGLLAGVDRLLSFLPAALSPRHRWPTTRSCPCSRHRSIPRSNGIR